MAMFLPIIIAHETPNLISKSEKKLMGQGIKNNLFHKNGFVKV